MLETSTAANDPIFWMHHSFVDLLWEMYRQSKQVKSSTLAIIYLLILRQEQHEKQRIQLIIDNAVVSIILEQLSCAHLHQ